MTKTLHLLLDRTLSWPPVFAITALALVAIILALVVVLIVVIK